MFGNTYAIVGIGTMANDGRISDAVADYVRWEFLPADRESVLVALKREGSNHHRPRTLVGLVGRLWSRRRAARAARGETSRE